MNDAQNEGSVFFRRWAILVLRFRWLVLLALAVFTGYLSDLVQRTLRIDHNVEAFAPETSPEIQALYDYRKTFGRADPVIILIEGDVFSLPFLEKLQAFQADLSRLNIPVEVEERPEKNEPALPPPPDVENEFAEFEDDFDDEDEGFEERVDSRNTAQESAASQDVLGMNISRITSLINVRQIRGGDGQLEVVKLFEPLPSPDALREARQSVLADPFLVGQVVSPSGRHAVVTAYTRSDVSDEDVMRIANAVIELGETYSSQDFRVHVTGTPAIGSQLQAIVDSDMKVFGLYSAIAVFLALLWLFRSWIGVVGPLSVIGVSVIWTLGFMCYFDLPITILSSMIPAFLFCVGVGDSIHILSIYRDQRKLGVPGRDAIIDAAGVTGPPVFFTSITTMTGLLSLNFASVPAIIEMGIAGGVGVMIAWFLSLTLLPIILSFSPRSTLGMTNVQEQDVIDRTIGGLLERWIMGPAARILRSVRPQKAVNQTGELAPDWIDRFIGRCISFSRPIDGRPNHRGLLLKTLGLSVILVIGASQIEVFHDDLDMVPDDLPVKEAVRVLDENVGGVATAELVLSRPTGDFKDVEVIQGMDRLIADVLAYQEPDPTTGEPRNLVTHGMSLVDIAKETRRAVLDGNPDEYMAPKNQAESNDFLGLFENRAPTELRKLVTVDWAKTHITFRVRWQDATAYKGLIQFIEDSKEKHLGDSVEVAGTGPVYVGSRLVAVMLEDLAVSFGTAFFCVTLFMIIMLRDLKLGLIAMLPNLFPIATVVGFMGLTGIPMDLTALLIACIALGIAVDDTVHFLHHFRVSYAATGCCELAISSAAKHAGRAMVATSALLIVGFSMYCFGTNAAIFRFGLLTAFTVASAVLTDLIVLPAFLRWLYPQPVEEKESPQDPVASLSPQASADTM